MFPQENEYKSFLPKNAHGSPNFDKAAYTILWDGGTKVCSNVPGHMTKMATMPIYGKNLIKSSLERKGQ